MSTKSFAFGGYGACSCGSEEDGSCYFYESLPSIEGSVEEVVVDDKGRDCYGGSTVGVVGSRAHFFARVFLLLLLRGENRHKAAVTMTTGACEREGEKKARAAEKRTSNRKREKKNEFADSRKRQ